MRQLTLIRHGVTDWNSSGKFQGHSDIPLSSKGQAQAKALAKRLARFENIDLVYASPLARAVQTAEIALPGQQIHCDERLKELNFGVFEGRTMAENQEHADWAWWFSDPFRRQTPQGESYEQLRQRAVDWLQNLPAAEHIMAFSHSGTIQMLISHIIGVERPRWRKRIYLRHTGITRVLFKGDETVIERVNDTRHLSQENGDPFDE